MITRATIKVTPVLELERSKVFRVFWVRVGVGCGRVQPTERKGEKEKENIGNTCVVWIAELNKGLRRRRSWV